MKKKINYVELLKEYPERATLETKSDGFFMFKELRKIGDSDVIVAMDSSLSEILYDAYGAKIGAKDDKREGMQPAKPSNIKFDIAVFKPYDKVLIQKINGVWFPDIMHGWVFTKNRTECHIFTFSELPFKRIIPYNDETKHLAFTSDECPKFYRYWENDTDENGDTSKVNKFKAWFSRLFRKNN